MSTIDDKTIYLANKPGRGLMDLRDEYLEGPIPYREQPEKGFTYRVTIYGSDMEFPDMLEDGSFFPERSITLLEIAERIERVSLRRKA